MYRKYINYYAVYSSVLYTNSSLRIFAALCLAGQILFGTNSNASGLSFAKLDRYFL